jgi:osmotically-inducible protein OsmY
MRTVAATLVLGAVAIAACRGDRPGEATTRSAEIDEPTAFQQSNAPADLAIARDVRTRLTADPKLGAPAKTAVVIVRGGVVTLRAEGVEAADRDRVLQHVSQVPGVVRVDDRLGTKE